MHFLAHTAGTAPPQDGTGPMEVDDVGDNNVPDQQEGARDKEDSILENLSPLSSDASSMDSEEYNHERDGRP
jgi:hypothetical protein